MKATTGFWLAPLLVSVPNLSRDLATGSGDLSTADTPDPYHADPVADPK